MAKQQTNQEIRAELYRLIDEINSEHDRGVETLTKCQALENYFNQHYNEIQKFVNEQDENGQTLLHKAVLIKGKADIVPALMGMGANPLITDKNGNIALSIRCWDQDILATNHFEHSLDKATKIKGLELIVEHVKDHPHLVDYVNGFLTKHGDIRLISSLCESIIKGDDKAYANLKEAVIARDHLLDEMFKAVMGGDIKRVDKLLTDNRDLVEHMNLETKKGYVFQDRKLDDNPEKGDCFLDQVAKAMFSPGQLPSENQKKAISLLHNKGVDTNGLLKKQGYFIDDIIKNLKTQNIRKIENKIFSHLSENQQALEKDTRNINFFLKNVNIPEGQLDNIYAQIASDIHYGRENTKGMNFIKQVAEKMPEIIKKNVGLHHYDEKQGAFAQWKGNDTMRSVRNSMKGLYLVELILEEALKNRKGDAQQVDKFRDTLTAVIEESIKKEGVGDMYGEIISNPKSFANSRFISSCAREVAKQTGMKREGLILKLVDKFMEFVESWHKDKAVEQKADKVVSKAQDSVDMRKSKMAEKLNTNIKMAQNKRKGAQK